MRKGSAGRILLTRCWGYLTWRLRISTTLRRYLRIGCPRLQRGLGGWRGLPPEHCQHHHHEQHDDADSDGQRDFTASHGAPPLLTTPCGFQRPVRLYGVLMRTTSTPRYRLCMAVCEDHIDVASKRRQHVLSGRVHVHRPWWLSARIHIGDRRKAAGKLSLVVQDVQVTAADKMIVDGVDDHAGGSNFFDRGKAHWGVASRPLRIGRVHAPASAVAFAMSACGAYGGSVRPGRPAQVDRSIGDGNATIGCAPLHNATVQSEVQPVRDIFGEQQGILGRAEYLVVLGVGSTSAIQVTNCPGSA